MKKILFASIVLWALILALVCWRLSLHNQVVYAFPQLKGGAAVEVKEWGARISLLELDPRYVLYFNQRGGGKYQGGHYVDISIFKRSDIDIQTYLDQCRLEEADDGITFVQPSGVRVFVPKAWYTDGR